MRAEPLQLLPVSIMLSVSGECRDRPGKIKAAKWIRYKNLNMYGTRYKNLNMDQLRVLNFEKQNTPMRAVVRARA